MDNILLSTADNPIPSNHTAGFFTAHDGLQLRYAIFRSTATVAKGTVVLLHGRNESIEKYFEVIRDINEMGLWVATFDWRGQGGSDRMLKNPTKGFVRRFSDYEQDLELFLNGIVLPDTRLPFFLVAHSMGGLIALSSAPFLANRIERMALVAPFVDLGGQKLSRGAIKIITRLSSAIGLGWLSVAKNRGLRAFEGNPLTSDRKRFKRNSDLLVAHPHLRLGPPTLRWTREMFEAMDRVNSLKFLAKIAIPTLILGASEDPIVPMRSIEKLATKFRAAKLIMFDGARHEILQESRRFRDPALAAIETFIPGSGDNPNAGPKATSTPIEPDPN